MKRDITSLFNKFAGREVPLKEVQKTFTGKHTGTFQYTEVTLDNPNDPTVAEMKKVAEDNGLSLRLWLPMGAGDCMEDLSRVNASIEKAPDGKWRVSDKFGIG